MEKHVVIGCTWCYLTNYQIDWHKQQAKMVYKGHATQVSLRQGELSMQSSMQNNSDPTIRKGKGKTILLQDPPSTKASQPPNLAPTSSTTPLHTPQPHPHPTPYPCNPMTSL